METGVSQLALALNVLGIFLGLTLFKCIMKTNASVIMLLYNSLAHFNTFRFSHKKSDSSYTHHILFINSLRPSDACMPQ